MPRTFAENDHAIDIVDLRPEGDRGNPRVDPFESIAGIRALKLRLDLWKQEEEVVNQRVERKEQRFQSSKNEIYQLLGIYFLFQGVILQALTQAANLPPSKRWIPLALSVLASLSTIMALVFKLEDCSELERQILGEKQLSKALYQASDSLKGMGSSYNYKELQILPRLQSSRPANRSFFATVWRNHMKGFGAFLLFILVIFSVIIAISCWFIHSP